MLRLMMYRSFSFVVLGLLLLSSGCDLDGSSSSSSSSSSRNEFVGTWEITKEGIPAYWFFFEDGTFRKNRGNQPQNGAVHFTGTYRVNHGTLSGEFVNPGVGRGEIKATIASDGRMLMDFIEFWHTPTKVVPCIGVRR